MAKRKSNITKNTIIISALVVVLYLSRSYIGTGFLYVEEFIKTLNFKMVAARGSVFTTGEDFKSRINISNDLEQYRKNYEDTYIKLQESKLKNIEMQNLIKENENMRKLLDLEQKSPLEYIAANVELIDGTGSSEKIYINKGLNDGIEEGLPVMFNGILVGKVNRVSKNFSEVVLITSKSSKISVSVNNTDIQILRGQGNGILTIQSYAGDSEGNVTDFVNLETSGMSDVYPINIPIGNLKVLNKKDFKKTKELNLKAPFNIQEIKTVLVYKFNKDDTLEQEIQNFRLEEIREN